MYPLYSEFSVLRRCPKTTCFLVDRLLSKCFAVGSAIGIILSSVCLSVTPCIVAVGVGGTTFGRYTDPESHNATGGISVYIPPKSVYLKFLCGCFVPLTQDKFDIAPVNIYSYPNQIPGYAPGVSSRQVLFVTKRSGKNELKKTRT